MSSLSMAGDLSEPGVYSGEEESHLLSPHQRRENSGGRDPHPERAAVQEEGLSFHLTLHLTGTGEGTAIQDKPQSNMLASVSDTCIAPTCALAIGKDRITTAMNLLCNNGTTPGCFAGPWISKLWPAAGLHGGGIRWEQGQISTSKAKK